jgi:hypothetical protein
MNYKLLPYVLIIASIVGLSISQGINFNNNKQLNEQINKQTEELVIQKNYITKSFNDLTSREGISFGDYLEKLNGLNEDLNKMQESIIKSNIASKIDFLNVINIEKQVCESVISKVKFSLESRKYLELAQEYGKEGETTKALNYLDESKKYINYAINANNDLIKFKKEYGILIAKCNLKIEHINFDNVIEEIEGEIE